jgi:hypothetical protein
MKGSSENPSNIWIDAYKSVINQLNTYPNNIDLIDVDGSGENKLAVAEFSNMISIYKGTNVEWQYQLPDQPTAVGQFNQSTGKSSLLSLTQDLSPSSLSPQTNTSI